MVKGKSPVVETTLQNVSSQVELSLRSEEETRGDAVDGTIKGIVIGSITERQSASFIYL